MTKEKILVGKRLSSHGLVIKLRSRIYEFI